MEYGQHIMEAKLMKDNDYIIAGRERKEEANFWQMKANKYTDILEEADKNVHYLKQQVMKLKKELEKGSNYKEDHQGKRASYNALTQETLTNTLNNEQAVSYTHMIISPLSITTRCPSSF